MMKDYLCKKQAEALRDFGYPDVTAEMVGEIWDEYSKGNDLPHGIIGMFCEKAFDEVKERRPDLFEATTNE